MPTYTYACDYCGAVERPFYHMDDVRPVLVPCPVCEYTMHRVYTPPNLAVFQEYTTANFGGEPVRVSSSRQERDLEQRHGVSRLTSGEMPKKEKPRMRPVKDDWDAVNYKWNQMGKEVQREMDNKFQKTGKAPEL